MDNFYAALNTQIRENPYEPKNSALSRTGSSKPLGKWILSAQRTLLRLVRLLWYRDITDTKESMSSRNQIWIASPVLVTKGAHIITG